MIDTHHLDAEGVDAVQAVGDPRLPSLLEALRAGGFTGWLTLEHTQDGDSPRAAVRSGAALTEAEAADVLARTVSPSRPRSTIGPF